MRYISKHTLDFLDSWLQLRYTWETIPGFVVAVAQDGEVIFNKAYGYADLETKTPMTTDHVFRIASHSKTFTATALMQLQEKGKLRIDDHVATYLPWLQGHRDKRWREVTLRQLMSHSAGVIRDGLDADYWQLMYDFPDAKKLQQEILKADLVLEPNTMMKYSNYGYSLLGLVVEKVSGIMYAEYVTKNIIDPLKLTSTKPEYNASLDVPSAYTRVFPDRTRRKIPHHAVTNAMVAATGFCSTSADLCRYFTAHMIGTGELLGDASKREMQHEAWKVPESKPQEYYGLGLEYEKFGKRRLPGHGGGFPGFVTKSVFDTKNKLVVVVLMNGNAAVGSAAKGVYSVLEQLGDYTPTDEEYTFEGRFTSLWATSEIVAKKKGLFALMPNGWAPFDDEESLEVVDADTLKITKTNGYYDPGELIHYERASDGAVIKIRSGGSTFHPSKDALPQTPWM